MKKFLTLFLSALTIVLCLTCFACKSNLTFKNDDSGNIESVVFVASDDVLLLNDQTTVADYLLALKEQGKLDFEASQSQYGLFINSVNGVENLTDQNGTHGFSWTLYTELAELNGVIYSVEDYGTYNANNKILNSASYGVSYTPCIKGYTYALVYSEWSY